MNQVSIANVTDPSDWYDTKLPEISQLESLQRCYICKEFLQAPVVTSCYHTFCSGCIRQHLLQKSSCPLCQSNQLESNLRRVAALEEMVKCFVDLRPQLLQLIQNNEPQNDASGLSATDLSTSAPSSSSTEPTEITDDVIVVEEPPRKKLKSEAECPICQKIMNAEFLQATHIDNCLKGKSNILPKKSKPEKKEILSFFKPKTQIKSNHQDFYFNEPHKHVHKETRLPKLDFSSLSISKLREKLSSINLPTTGTKNQLENRYNQYYVLYNSNLDSNHPVDVRVLRLRLSKWESSSSKSSDLFIKSGLSTRNITDKNFLVSEWKRAYHQEFVELKKQAVANLKSQNPRTNADIQKIAQVSDNPKQEMDIDLNSSILFVGEED